MGHAESFSRACDAAEWLKDARGGILPQYAASVALGRSLAARMDELEAGGWLNEADKPDTTTAPQYLRVLDALRLTPAALAKSQAGPQTSKATRRESSLEAFRRKSFTAVG